MSTSNCIIQVEEVSKKFKLYNDPIGGPLKEWLFWWRKGRETKEYVAVDRVSFQISKGETVGIVGSNGAGKTTLLKMIAGLLTFDGGSISVKGKVTAMLALGLGVHPEFTGRENILYNGLLLGMSKAEIRKKMAGIIDFAELEQFIDQPFRTYSAGMRARLLFATSMSVDPDILIIDEALATGDIQFIQKCRQRIQELCCSGATVLFVSHSMAQVQAITRRSLVMHHGQMIFDGNTEDAITHYVEKLYEEQDSRLDQHNRERSRNRHVSAVVMAHGKVTPLGRNLGTGAIIVTDLYLRVDGGCTNTLVVGKPCQLTIVCETSQRIKSVRWCIWLRSGKSPVTYAFLPPVPELMANTASGTQFDFEPGITTITIHIPQVALGDGEYSCDLSFYPLEADREFHPSKAYCHLVEAKRFQVVYRHPQQFGRGTMTELLIGRIDVAHEGASSFLARAS